MGQGNRAPRGNDHSAAPPPRALPRGDAAP